MTLAVDEVLPEQPTGEVVHWMDPAPFRLSPMAAFALGAAAAVGTFFLVRYMGSRREMLPPWRWGRRGPTLH